MAVRLLSPVIFEIVVKPGQHLKDTLFLCRAIAKATSFSVAVRSAVSIDKRCLNSSMLLSLFSSSFKIPPGGFPGLGLLPGADP